MGLRFETLGNASVMVFDEDHPVLATDPWFVGTCYFGSWALDHALTPEQIENFRNADYLWISHGHPDHLHDESLALLPRGKRVLLPDHYCDEIATHLKQLGFDVTVLPYRSWFRLSPRVRVLCVDNVNQDAILAIEADGSLILNLNDSPLCGEFHFLHRLVRAYPRQNTYLLALCSVDADMFNFVDAAGHSLVGPPEERKPGAIWGVARTADRLGVGNFCCSSSQHIYVRADSIWANPYRIGWRDMQRHWSRPDVRLVEPFVTVDLDDGSITRNHPSQESDTSQISPTTGDDDWQATLSAEEWTRVEAFIRRFEMVRAYVDFVEFTVGDEIRRFDLNPAGTRPEHRRRGVAFIVPRQSLLTTVEYGYLDDLLIGNFMRVRLINTALYPRFTPLVAKVGGNAKVHTQTQYRRFLARYFLRNPLGMSRYYLEAAMNYRVIPLFRRAAEDFGIKRPLKYLYRTMLGDPVRHG
ncbi:MAG TPA: hypothetical protein VMB34_02480 [Acetobacteraceae bacterium]|nr:hypothetical protein [Acetobacteraceae bacterium]